MIAIGPAAERDNTRLESESYAEGEEAIPIVAVQDLSFRWSVRAPYVLGIGELSIQRGERVYRRPERQRQNHALESASRRGDA